MTLQIGRNAPYGVYNMNECDGRRMWYSFDLLSSTCIIELGDGYHCIAYPGYGKDGYRLGFGTSVFGSDGIE